MSLKRTNNSAADNIALIGITVLLILLVLAYIFSAGKVNYLSTDFYTKKKNLREKKKLIQSRYDRIQKILERKKAIKTKLDKIANVVLFSVRLILVLMILTICFWLVYYINISVIEIIEYIGGLVILLGLISFIIFGSPASFLSLWDYLGKKLKLLIYGKYIDLDKHIDSHNRELAELSVEKSEVEKELKEIKEAEIEIVKILNSTDSTSNQIEIA